jgi:hypothetical protein
MKKIIIVFALGLNGIAFSQTAVNFNVDDCHGVNHDLFGELNSGKIIVIAWVMPCGGCISGALAGYTSAQSFASSHPGRVLFYLADDYANTTCNTLGNWGTNNGMAEAVPFSNAAVSMSDYGTDGMPKVIVLGGTSHTVFYNENNNAITDSGITDAINTALAASTNSVEENLISKEKTIYPNPGNVVVNIDLASLGLDMGSEISVILKDAAGKEVLEIVKGKIITAETQSVQLNTGQLANGNYFVHYSDDKSAGVLKIVVAH